jgi:hypothetical protein
MVMKKSILFLFCILAMALFIVSFDAKSQAWVIYDGSVLPTDNTPAFTAGDNSPDAGFVAEVIDDPDITGNKLFKYDHSVIEGKQTYKMSWEIGGGTAATIVARIKGIAGTSSIRVAEIDVRNVNSAVGSKLQIGYDDSVRLESPALVAYLEKTSEWHLYRFVMNGADFTLYVDEKPTPFLSGTSAKERTDNWFKFGDQSASYSHSGLFDYIIWDISGAYAPGEGAAIPENLSKAYYGMTSYNYCVADPGNPYLYPNPSSGQVNISSPESWINAGYMIVNSLGQKVGSGLITGALTVVNTANLPGGAYTLVVCPADNTIHREQFIHLVQ